MIFQLSLSVVLLGTVVYVFSQRTKSPLICTLSMLLGGAGGYFVWFPDHANFVADMAGIGRGADLILYCWVVISFLLFINFHLKLKSDRELITKLVRHVAINDAKNK